MLPKEDKNLLKMIHMKREILGEDKDVIHVDKAERKITQNLIYKALYMPRNSNILKGVRMVVFWTSSGETVT